MSVCPLTHRHKKVKHRIKCGEKNCILSLILSKVYISWVKPKLNSSETMLTIVGGNLRRNLLKSIPSTEKFFKKVKMSKPFQLFELNMYLDLAHPPTKLITQCLICNLWEEKKIKKVYVHFFFKKSKRKLQQQCWSENRQKHGSDGFLSILKLIICS